MHCVTTTSVSETSLRVIPGLGVRDVIHLYYAYHLHDLAEAEWMDH